MKTKTQQPSELDQFKKGNTEKLDSMQTAVNITKLQHEFITSNGLNLSKIVRSRIDELMQLSTTKKRG